MRVINACVLMRCNACDNACDYMRVFNACV